MQDWGRGRWAPESVAAKTPRCLNGNRKKADFQSDCGNARQIVVFGRQGWGKCAGVALGIRHGAGQKTRFADLLQFTPAGPFAWRSGEPGQVGNEAATAVSRQCRSQARHPIPRIAAVSQRSVFICAVVPLMWGLAGVLQVAGGGCILAFPPHLQARRLPFHACARPGALLPLAPPSLPSPRLQSLHDLSGAGSQMAAAFV